jgi:hypothetical protein
MEGDCDFTGVDFRLGDWQINNNREKWDRAMEVEKFLSQNKHG